MSHDRCAHAGPARNRFDERRDSDRSRGIEILLCRAGHDDPARHVEACRREDRLRDLLVHSERRREHARSGVRDADRVEQTLDAPVLPPCPMQSDEDDVDRLVVRHHPRRRDQGARSALDLFLETARKLVVTFEPAATFDEALRLFALLGRDLRIARHERERVEQDDLEAARIEALRDLRTGRERDVALRRRAASQHADTDFHHSPTSSTSGTSFTLNFLATSCWTSVMRARTSSAVAPPVLTMKFACLGLTIAPPTAWPLSPAASTRRPAKSPGGFRKIDPVFGCASGCFLIRSLAISLIRLTAFARSPPFPRKRARTHTIGVPCRELVR